MNQQAWATEEGTASYRNRFAGKVGENHFRHEHGLWMTSIGIGTYLGSHDDSTDDLYRQAVVRAMEMGGNVNVGRGLKPNRLSIQPSKPALHYTTIRI